MVNPVFEDFKVNVFHAVDFQLSRGEFKGWDGFKKRAFLENVYDCAKLFVIEGIAAFVNKEDFKAIRKKDSRLQNTSAYGLALNSIITSIIEKGPPYIERRRRRIDFFIEEGNKSNGNLENAVRWHRGFMDYGPLMGDVAQIPKRRCRAIQLADALAYYGRRQNDTWARAGYPNTTGPDHSTPFFEISEPRVRHRFNRLFGKLGEVSGRAPRDEENCILLPDGSGGTG